MKIAFIFDKYFLSLCAESLFFCKYTDERKACLQ
jgi:hypothetical protein